MKSDGLVNGRQLQRHIGLYFNPALVIKESRLGIRQGFGYDNNITGASIVPSGRMALLTFTHCFLLRES